MTLVVVPEHGTALDVLAARYRAAYEKTQTGLEQWIDGTLELAGVMVEARERFPGDSQFGDWLSRHQLKHFHPNDRMALIGIGKLKPETARKLLEDNLGLAWRTIWEKKAKGSQRALTSPGKGALRPNRSDGHFRRTRIPDVMRDDLPPPPPVRKGVDLKGLSKEEVDPDFKGTDIEFATKYGHVNLHTKKQIEHNKQQDVLMDWAGKVSDLDRIARAMLFVFAAVDPTALSEWLSKPSKLEKLKTWCNNIELACESLRTISNR